MTDAPFTLPLPPALLAELELAYASPPRAYHSFAHVGEVAREFAAVAREVGWHQPHEVFLAVLFHDAVYRAGAIDNETASAALARDAIARHELPVAADRVAALIALTARHGSLTADELADDRDAALFLDCDMAILGAAPAAFDAYSHAIRAEYAHVPDAAFAAGRAAFLERVLASPRIYHSDHVHWRLEEPARANLARELARLR